MNTEVREVYSVQAQPAVEQYKSSLCSSPALELTLDWLPRCRRNSNRPRLASVDFHQESVLKWEGNFQKMFNFLIMYFFVIVYMSVSAGASTASRGHTSPWSWSCRLF